jgi:hypothetical protein
MVRTVQQPYHNRTHRRRDTFAIPCRILSLRLCAEASWHMTLTPPSLSLSRAARSSLLYISRPTIFFAPTPFKSTATIRKMSNPSKAKSEEEWRAILSPEQVRPSLSPQLVTFELPVSRKSTRAVQGAPDEGHGATRDGRVRASQ